MLNTRTSVLSPCTLPRPPGLLTARPPNEDAGHKQAIQANVGVERPAQTPRRYWMGMVSWLYHDMIVSKVRGETDAADLVEVEVEARRLETRLPHMFPATPVGMFRHFSPLFRRHLPHFGMNPLENPISRIRYKGYPEIECQRYWDTLPPQLANLPLSRDGQS